MDNSNSHKVVAWLFLWILIMGAAAYTAFGDTSTGTVTVGVTNAGTCSATFVMDLLDDNTVKSSAFYNVGSVSAGSAVSAVVGCSSSGTWTGQMNVRLRRQGDNMYLLRFDAAMSGSTPTRLAVFSGGGAAVSGVPGACTTNICNATNVLWTFTVWNSSSTTMRWQAFQDGAPICNQWGDVQPGRVANVEFTTLEGCGYGTHDVTVRSLRLGEWTVSGCGSGGSYAVSTDGYGDSLGTGYSTNSYISGGGYGAGSGDTSTNDWNGPYIGLYDRTNEPVFFGATNDAQAGFNALYSLEGQGFADLGSKLGQLRDNSETQMTNDARSLATLQGITNRQALQSTQLLGISNAVFNAQVGIVGSVRTNQMALSNRLDFLGGYLSNALASTGGGGNDGVSNAVAAFHADWLSTNISGGQLASSNFAAIDGLIPGLTNVSGATNNALASMQAAHDAIQQVVDELGDAPDIGTPGEPDMTISISGHTLDLNPVHIIPGAAPLCRAIMTYLLLAAFAMWAAKLFFECAQTFAAHQTGGVPDIESTIAGFGGNMLGMIVAVAVPFAIIAVWVGVFTAITARLLPQIVALVGNGNPLTGAGPMALYLLDSFFPVNLAFSLVWTAILLQLVMGKLVMLSAAASRFLVAH